MPVNQKNEPECNCIMSGFAQTTNYCPVHKGVPIKNEPQQMYRFRKWISDEERAEVMKIIKYTKGGLIYQDSYDAHPELQSYFELVNQNEPQLEDNIEKQTLKKIYKIVMENGSADRSFILHKLARIIQDEEKL